MFDSVALSSKTISSASKKSLDVTISIYSDVASQRHEPSRLFVACTVAHAFGTKAGASNTDASLARIESIPAVGTSPMFPGFWRVLERHAWSCVCVDHLHRCKTSFCLVDGFVLCLLDFELRLQGAQVWLWFLCQRRRPDVTVISKGDVPLTYLPTMFFQFPIWEEAQPKNLHVVHLKISIFCTVGAIWTFLVIYNWFCYIRTFLRART